MTVTYQKHQAALAQLRADFVEQMVQPIAPAPLLLTRAELKRSWETFIDEVDQQESIGAKTTVARFRRSGPGQAAYKSLAGKK